MRKGIDYFESTEGTKGSIVLVPRRLVRVLSLEEAAESPGTDDETEASGIYERICEGNEWLRLIPFEDGDMLRMGEASNPVFWINRPDGALAVQWQGADSEEQLLNFAENADGDVWDEEIHFDAGDGHFFLSDCTQVLWGDDDSELCQVSLPKGQYTVTARWAESETVSAIIFRFSRKG